MRGFWFLGVVALAAGCSLPVIPPFSPTPNLPPRATAKPMPAPELVAEAPPELAPMPKPMAQSAEALDTTTEAERAAATAAPKASGKRIGTTVISLGDPTDAGFWLKTALVSAPQEGRIELVESGKSVKVGLFPLSAKGGSQISLPAMRALGLELTAMPEVVVYRK